MPISGLHSCQQKNTPYTGDVKNFLVTQETGKSGKAYTKIRNASTDMGGRPYEVLSVTKTDYSDAHGNLSFNLEIEPVTVSDKRTEPARPLPDGAVRVPAANGYEDRGNRIERQHSQEMAIRYAALKGLKDITPKDMVALIDWFARDVSRTPAPAKKKAQPEQEFSSGITISGEGEITELKDEEEF